MAIFLNQGNTCQERQLSWSSASYDNTINFLEPRNLCQQWQPWLRKLSDNNDTFWNQGISWQRQQLSLNNNHLITMSTSELGRLLSCRYIYVPIIFAEISPLRWVYLHLQRFFLFVASLILYILDPPNLGKQIVPGANQVPSASCSRPSHGRRGRQHLNLNSQRPHWRETPGSSHCDSSLTDSVTEAGNSIFTYEKLISEVLLSWLLDSVVWKFIS